MKSELQRAKDKADKYFSLYVRQRDAISGIARCCTCGERHHWKQIDCGHFMSRRYQSTRFDEKNCAPQCRACNRFNQGRQFEMGKYLDKKYGFGTANKMEMHSKMFCKRYRYDYEVIADTFKNKLKIIKNKC
jgi:hypothetical protein